ncbi:antiterminator Q family protein [Pseudomonas boanensis]|uniref:antiterminator Q family protein n=1 Tax=Metapseudomonas boanensis TaxID=2822138 RepID=UPI0035D462DF
MAKQMDTVYLLQEWGIWLRYETGLPGYVSQFGALMRDCVEDDGALPRAIISEDLCMMVDGVVARLGKRDPVMGAALWLYYRYEGMSYSRLSKLLEVSRSKVEWLVKGGEVWVDAVLEERREA